MNFDLRLPLGILFSLLGSMLTIFGLLTPKELYARSMGINVNLDWGLVILAFGVIMLTFALRARTSRSRS